MKIQKDGITIRNAEKTDCDQLAAWWNDGNVMAHAGFPLGLNTTAEEIENQIAQDSDETKRRLIIEYQDQPIGEMSYYNIGNETAEIGIKICNPEFQERGLGRVILSMLICQLFSCGYTKIILDTNLNNTRAQHVYEKLGFQKTGVRENPWKNQLGELQSSIDYELKPDEFMEQPPDVLIGPVRFIQGIQQEYTARISGGSQCYGSCHLLRRDDQRLHPGQHIGG